MINLQTCQKCRQRNEQEEEKRAELHKRIARAEEEATAARKDAEKARAELRRWHDTLARWIDDMSKEAIARSVIAGVAAEVEGANVAGVAAPPGFVVWRDEATPPGPITCSLCGYEYNAAASGCPQCADDKRRDPIVLGSGS